MSGAVAVKIAHQMNKRSDFVRRGFSTKHTEMSYFAGYLASLEDMNLITRDEYQMFHAEFIRMIIK